MGYKIILGYKIIRLDRQIHKKGGGIMFYLRNDCTWDLLLLHSLISNGNIEILSTIIHRKWAKRECVSIVYLPPKSDKAKALETIDEVADVINKLGLNWTLGGDF